MSDRNAKADSSGDLHEIMALQAEIERLHACCRHRDEQISTLCGFCNHKDSEIERLRAALELAQDHLDGEAWIAVDLALTEWGGEK